MDNYIKIQAIQGILTDFEKRYFFQASQGSKESWDEETMNKSTRQTLEAITEIINYEVE